MILDTSAIVALLLDEPEAENIARRIDEEDHIRISAATLVELAAVLMRSRTPAHWRRAQRMLDSWKVETVPFDADQANIASGAYRDYGRGSGHAASLNFGDCFSYALASSLDEPLLFVGDDFAHTDLTPAL